MAKQSGLGDNFYVGGYNLSSATQSIARIGGGPAALDMTSIDKSGYERQGGLRTGEINWTSYFDKASGGAHAGLKSLPDSDTIVTYFRGTALGNPAACCTAKRVTYDGTRGTDGMFTLSVNAQSNAYGLDWGIQGTPGIASYTGDSSGTAFQIGGTTPLVQGDGSHGVASTPDAAALGITGDIDLRVRVAPADWTPSAAQYLIAKSVATSNQRSYALSLSTSGALVLEWSTDGTSANLISKTSTANLSGLADGALKWVRATLDVDNGASGNTVTFYTSDDGSSWTQLGGAVTTAGTTSIFDSTAPLELGARNNSGADYFSGKIFAAEVRNGIAGTAVATPTVDGSTGFIDGVGNTWTNRTGAINSADNRNGIVSYLQVFSLTGSAAFIGLNGSLDDGVNDAYANTLGNLEHGVSTAPYASRLAMPAGSVAEKYLKPYIVGSFTQISLALVIVAHETPVTY